MIGIIDYNAGNITSVERALRNLNIDLYEYRDIIYLISEKIYKTFKVGQKQDILGKAYKIFLSRAGKVDNKNIILSNIALRSNVF